MNLDISSINLLWSSSIIDQIIKSGINQFVVSPGYRCAPLLYILNKHQEIKTTVVLDERSAAYYALGAIKATKRPAVLICTSGTAVANYFPAIIEAYHDHLPLLILTADRAFEDWNVDANQSINQQHIYGSYVGHELNLPAPSTDVPLLNVVTKVKNIIKNLFLASRPVHINLPFRPPLEKAISHVDPLYCSDIKFISAFDFSYSQNLSTNNNSVLFNMKREIKKIIEKINRPLVVVGNLRIDEDLNKIERFLKKLKIPFFVDISSSLKYRFSLDDQGAYVPTIDHPFFDSIIKEKYRPDLIIHLGNRLVSNHYYLTLKKENFFEIQISEGTDLKDPSSRVLQDFNLKVSDFCDDSEEIVHLLNRNIMEEISHEIKIAHKKLIKRSIDMDVFSHVTIVREIISQAGDEEVLYIGNSTPIRAFDNYSFHQKNKNLSIITHRGVSGIEGFVSSARSYQENSKKRTTLILGDISLLHDFSSLLYLEKEKNFKIVVINNHRGGIFSTLPLKNFDGFLNNLVESPHQISFVDRCQNYPIHLAKCLSLEEFSSALSNSLSDKECWLIEAVIDHDQDLEACQLFRKDF